MSNAKFKVGDRVKKPLGYEFPGEVRAVFTTMADAPRVVVEMTDAQGKGRGLLHIFAESQIVHAEG